MSSSNYADESSRGAACVTQEILKFCKKNSKKKFASGKKCKKKEATHTIGSARVML